jgi:hypothetical protein
METLAMSLGFDCLNALVEDAESRGLPLQAGDVHHPAPVRPGEETFDLQLQKAQGSARLTMAALPRSPVLARG